MPNDVSIWVRVKDGFTTNLKRASANFKQMSKDVLTSARTYAAGFAVITGAVVKSVAEFRNFNKQMARVEGLLGGVKADHLRKEIMSLSAEIGIAKEQLTEGLYNALSAGIPEDNVITFMRTAAKAAAVDGSDLSVVVDGVTTVINAFGLKAKDAEKASNAMFSAVAAGKTNMFELSSSLSQVATIASTSGVSFNEIFAALANMTAQGTKTAQAVTQIRSAIIAANDVLGDGWSVTMNLMEAFQALSDRSNGSNKELKELVGRVEAVNAILANTGINAGGAAEALEKLQTNAMDLGEIFEGTTQQALAYDRLWEAIRNQFINTGESVDSVLAPALDQLTESLERNRQGLDDNANGWDVLIGVLAATAGGGILGIGMVIDEVQRKLDEFKNGAKDLKDIDVAPEAEPAGEDRSEYLAKLLKDIETLENKAKNSEQKKAEAMREFRLKMLKIEKEYNEAMQAMYDDEVDAFLRAEDEKTEKAEDAAKQRKENAKRLQDMELQEKIQRLNKEAQAAEKLAGEGGLAERVRERERQAEEADERAKEDEKIERRLRRMSEKEKRGIKLSKEDIALRENVNEIRAAEKEAQEKRAEAIRIQKEIRDGIKQVLMAAPGPA